MLRVRTSNSALVFIVICTIGYINFYVKCFQEIGVHASTSDIFDTYQELEEERKEIVTLS